MPDFCRLAEAAAAVHRICETAHFREFPELIEWARNAPQPDLAIASLERWLSASSNPATWLEALDANHENARRLVILFGSSDHSGQVLIQNPEMASAVLELEHTLPTDVSSAIQAQIASMVTVASSYTHSLDRLRYVKQFWTILFAVQDIFHLDTQPEIWKHLSILADELIRAALSLSWKDFSIEKGVSGPVPIEVAALGKLGGSEINYSSDVDLLYIQSPGATPDAIPFVDRFCQKFSKALTEPMGRGSLYRVDLRLRPYGGAGSVAVSWDGLESYYHRYAEDWEVLALIRSRMVIGAIERWNQLRHEICFRINRSEWFVDNVLDMRKKIEGHSSSDDIKRGPGGIRDVEFLCQLIQITAGANVAQLQGRSTLEVLEASKALGLVTNGDSAKLHDAYVWLRMLEHRLQLQSNLQTHSLPTATEQLEPLAVLMNLRTPSTLLQELARQREKVRSVWTKMVQGHSTSPASIPLPPVLDQWIHSLNDFDRIRAAIQSNANSLDIVLSIADRVPVALKFLHGDDTLAEEIVSGEIDESHNAGRVDSADALRRSIARTLIRVARVPEGANLGEEISVLYDQFLADAFPHSPFDIVALGSYAMNELSIGSDLDLVLLVSDDQDHARAEIAAQGFLQSIHSFKHQGAPIDVDLRLRPEGASGLLVRTLSGFAKYADTDMEPWERMALQRHRAVVADAVTADAFLRAAFAAPLGAAALVELKSIKNRVENERLTTESAWRDIKLGHGGLMDIEWATQLYTWRAVTNGSPVAHANTTERIDWLTSEIQSISSEDAQTLKSAHFHHLQVREVISLLAFGANVIPENPDKLTRVAQVLGFATSDEFLTQDLSLRQSVRKVYQTLLSRLEL